MNVNFYKKLLSFRSHSKSECQIVFRDWLRHHIHENYANIQSDIDKYGNLYIYKGEAEIVNCVIAHLDINQKTKTDNFHIAQVDQWILGINKDTGLQVGLGHDDKAGVYFALQALKKFDNLKVFFPLDEEIGLVGTRDCELAFFGNVGFMVQLDRRGFKDISNYTNGNDVLTKESQEEFQEICDKYGYAYARCISTDVGNLVGRLDTQGVNISCGYYDEHSDKEVLNIYQYDNAERFALTLLKHTNGKKYTIEQKKYTPPAYSGNYGSSTNSYTRNTTTYQRKPNTTNSSVGGQLSVVKGGKTNANDHLIDRSPKVEPKPQERPIDSYDRSPSYVNSAHLFEDDDEGLGTVPVVVKTLEDKVTDFQFAWHNGNDLELMALNDTDVLLHGYKALINYLVKETVMPDDELVQTLEGLDEEILLVEIEGQHDLTEARNHLQVSKNMIEAYLEREKTLKDETSHHAID